MDSERSTTAQGNAFRDDVAALLRAAHLEDVETEVRIRHKKVDITFFETTLTQRRRVAVECKDYDRPLTKAQIKEEIYSDYWPLIDEIEIDGLLIVGRVAPNADARSYIDSIRGFQFKTYTELQNGLMNFGSYLQAMRAQFQEQGLNQYYVKPRLEDGGDLEERVLRWLGESSSRPVAILAGYGMGKTSFARRAASLVALEHSRSPDTRIPILIRLGEIANEQGLEGLLGKVFTATNVVRNYHFELFMELNRAGRFFIILDGFDEMKHTMSWPHFKYNFGELNRLVVPNSKVLLLGRPSAFLSDLEHNWALRGVATVGAKQLREPGWPDYEELGIAGFTPETAYQFMASYIAYFRGIARSAGEGVTDEEKTSRRLAEVRSIGFDYLIVRPVQARMLAEIAADTGIELRQFSRFELYDVFITRLIDREQTKNARRPIEGGHRRRFIRTVAWWLWSTVGASGFSADKLPKNLVAPFDVNDEHDLDALKRELLTGSLLEKKAGNQFYFAHRSFQEFLVAEYMGERAWTIADIHEAARALTPEVDRFLRESGHLGTIQGWVHLLVQPKMGIAVEFLRLIAFALKSESGSLEKLPEFQHPLAIIILSLRRYSDNDLGTDEAFDAALRFFSAPSSTVPMRMAALAAALLAANTMQELHAEHFEKLVALILTECVDELGNILARTGRGKSVAGDSVNPFARLVVACFQQAEGSAGANIKLQIDLDGLFEEVQRFFAPGVTYAWAMLEPLQVSVEVLGAYAGLLAMSEKGGLIAKFFKQFPDPARSIVPVTTRSRLSPPRHRG